MLKKKINYTDYNGTERSEDYYFNLTKAELLYMSTIGDFADNMQRVMDNPNDTASIVKVIRQLILSSYGKKTEDGKRFLKTDEIREEFDQSEAYSELFMELTTNSDKAVEFMNAVIPEIDLPKNENKSVAPLEVIK